MIDVQLIDAPTAGKRIGVWDVYHRDSLESAIQLWADLGWDFIGVIDKGSAMKAVWWTLLFVADKDKLIRKPEPVR